MFSKIQRIRAYGFKNIFLCMVKKKYFSLKQKKYGFDHWHSSAPFECRSYKKVVVDLTESVSPEVVVEVGCGLGEIVSRVKSKRRIGLDYDVKVIAAAKDLNGNGVEYKQGSIDELIKLNIQQIDVLIMVNWVHGVECEVIRNELLKLLQKATVKYLLVDRIKDIQEGYKFHHDWEKCLGSFMRLVDIRDGGVERVRDLYLLEVVNESE